MASWIILGLFIPVLETKAMTPSTILRATVLFCPQLSLSRTPTLIKCTNNKNDRNLKDALSGMVNSQVDELLQREENKALLQGLEEATQRVENAKRRLADIQTREIETRRIRDKIAQLEAKDSEIAECQREILEAKSKFEEAELSLADTSGVGIFSTEDDSGEVSKDEERWESLKAASISALLGTLVSLPISFTQVTTTSELILPVATTFASCALFGVTFRYIIRRDLDNFQLKNGASAAFGVVKGLATLSGGTPLELSKESLLDHALGGAFYISQNLFIFLFAAVGLDFCFKLGLLRTYPVRRVTSRYISK